LPSEKGIMSGAYLTVGRFPRGARAWLTSAMAILLVLVSPGTGGAQLRDEEFIRQQAPPYLARFQKELEICEKDWQQRKGPRPLVLRRLSQLCFYLGELAEPGQRHAYYEKGKHYAEILRKEQPHRVEGHYWLAANLAGIAEVGGAGKALQMLPEVVEIFSQAASLEPAYDQAGAHRALGSIFCEAPAWPISVGDLDKARHHLTLAVRLAPENSTNHLYLGYTLLQLGRIPEAKAELQQVFKATAHPVWPLGVEHDRREARRLLKKLKETAARPKQSPGIAPGRP
jgi:tetratricopeptide (TPR) repeat protein